MHDRVRVGFPSVSISHYPCQALAQLARCTSSTLLLSLLPRLMRTEEKTTGFQTSNQPTRTSMYSQRHKDTPLSDRGNKFQLVRDANSQIFSRKGFIKLAPTEIDSHYGYLPHRMLCIVVSQSHSNHVKAPVREHNS